MDLKHEFTVPTSPTATWEAFGDIKEVAQCFPGATVSNADEETFEGIVKVKLGPVSLVYTGEGRFTERDEASRTMKLTANGKDKRGNGTAGADVVLTMTEADGGRTAVSVSTDLKITGKPAQFGRGMIQDVSDKLLGQFVSCLEQRLVEDPAEGAEETNGLGPSGAAIAANRAGGDTDQPLSASADPIGDEASGAAEPRPAPKDANRSGGHLRPITDVDTSGEAIDLGAAVLPAMARRYGPYAAVVVVLLVLLRRRRRA
ncbi:SRPBCC family protein [Nocardioidaceae bacterium]|nr:SRPBCC family protein [Nocardioidaceae bacterium]